MNIKEVINNIKNDNYMEGKGMLYQCPKEVKDIIEKNFESLDSFYAYVYQIGVRQHESFQRTGNIDSGEEYRLKNYLEKIGIDPFFADDLVSEIIGDYDEVLANNYAMTLLGPNWREKIETFEAMINHSSL